MRSLAMVILTLEVILVHDVGRAATADGEGRIRGRVLSENAAIAALVREATERSPTFRDLLETIAATNGIVDVEEGKCGHSVRACLSLFVQAAGPFRVLHVLVINRGAADCDLMASVGHELQHAIELLRDPHITDLASAYSFFDRVGPTGSGRFETPAAVYAGDQVGREACGRRKSRSPGGTR
jgi:hypothetical protein